MAFREMNKKAFVERLVEAGWDRKEAEAEYERAVSGQDGTEDACDF